VNVGIGNNGTYERSSVPLVPGANFITVTASDQFANFVSRQITVQYSPLTNAPRLEVVAGDLQATNVHRRLAQPIVVRALRADGSPFANKLLIFAVTRSDGRLLPVDAGAVANPVAFSNDVTRTVHGVMQLQLWTDANGEARAWWALGGDAGHGNNRACVMSAGIPNTVYFCASARPAAPTQINIGTGNNQKVEVGAFVSEPLRAWVNDSCNGIEGMPVTFTIIQGGGCLFPSPGGEGQGEGGTNLLTILSSRTGHAEARLQLGPDAGANFIEANFPGNPSQPATFIAYGVARDLSRPTKLSGLVLDNASRPIGGATCELSAGGAMFSTTTDTQGQFHFTDPPAGSAQLFVNGLTATELNSEPVPSGSFPSLEYSLILIPNAENSLPSPVLLPRLNPANARVYYGTNDLVLTCEGMAGLKMFIKAGSMRRRDGTSPTPQNPTIIALNQVHHDDVPMPMPDGAAPPFAWTLQPGGATFDPPITIEYPNMSGLPAGTVAYFLSFNHDTARFEIIASGHVKEDGATIVTDPGAGLTVAGWGGNCPPYAVTGDAEKKDPCETHDALSKDYESKRGTDAAALAHQLACLSRKAAGVGPDGKCGTPPSWAQGWPGDMLSDIANNRQSNPSPADQLCNQMPSWLDFTLSFHGLFNSTDVCALGGGFYHFQDELYPGFENNMRRALQNGESKEKVRRDHEGLINEIADCFLGEVDELSDIPRLIAGGSVPPVARHARESVLEVLCAELDGGGQFAPFAAAAFPPLPPPLPREVLYSPLLEGLFALRVRSADRFFLNVGQQFQLTVTDASGNDLTHSSTGTQYFVGVGDGSVTVSPNGLLTILATPYPLPSVTPVFFVYAANGTNVGLGQFAVIDADTDGDWIADSYEVRVGLNPNVPNALNSDLDEDGVADIIECLVVTDPLLGDSDNDGLNDGCELNQGSGPRSPFSRDPKLWPGGVVRVGGQSVAVDRLGSFRVANIAAADEFGPGGPGTVSDFVSDDFIRVVATGSRPCPSRATYAFSIPFQIRRGETFVITNLTFTDFPPLLPDSIRAVPDNPTLTALSQTTQVRVMATLHDGSTSDVTLRTRWTVYRTSNPAVATVDENGLVTARAKGKVFITAVNEGTTSVCQIDVSPGDPLTTVFGYVQTTNGALVAGATVSIVGIAALPVFSAPNGSFAISNVPTTFGLFRVAARLVTTTALFGTSGMLDPVPGGITDAGILTLRQGVAWVGGVSGVWHGPTNWSTGQVPGPTNDVYISASPGVTVTISQGTNIVTSLLLESPLTISGGSLRSLTAIQANVPVTLNGGRLINSTLTGGALPAVICGNNGNNRLDGVTVNGGLDLTLNGAEAIVTNGLVLNGTAAVGNPSNNASAALHFHGTQTLGGNGIVVFGQYPSPDAIALHVPLAGSTLTIGPTITVRGRNGTVGRAVNWWLGSTSVGVVNQGTISADVNGGMISVRADCFTNQATLEARNGGSLTLLDCWQNQGLMRVDGGTWNLGGQFPTTAIGAVERTGGTVNLTGVLDNGGRTLVLDASSGSWALDGGTIRGGTVTSTAGARLIVANHDSNRLDGVTVNGNLDVWNVNGATLAVTNGLVLNGTMQVGHPATNWYGRIHFEGSQNLSGNGAAVLGRYPDERYNSLRLTVAGTTLMLGSGVTVRGENGTIGYSSLWSGPQNVSVVNQGTILADVSGGTIVAYASCFTNQAMLETKNGGTLTLLNCWQNQGLVRVNGGTWNLGGQFSTPALGSIQRTGGVVNIVGVLNNSGQTLLLNGSRGSWTLNGGTILGGAVTNSEGARLLAGNNANSRLDGVTVNGHLDVGAVNGAVVVVTNGLVLNGSMQVGHATSNWHGRIHFEGTQTLSGNGTAVLGRFTDERFNALRPSLAGATLTFGPGITVRGENGTIGYSSWWGGPPDVSVLNQGTISADVNGGTIVIRAMPFTNNGTTNELNGGRLIIQ
jgi:hypothetical protein